MGTDKQELRCVIGMIRHGDRTPKQKLKFKTTCPAIMALWHHKCAKGPKKPRKELKLKNVDELKAMLDVIQVLIARGLEDEKHKADLRMSQETVKAPV